MQTFRTKIVSFCKIGGSIVSNSPYADTSLEKKGSAFNVRITKAEKETNHIPGACEAYQTPGIFYVDFTISDFRILHTLCMINS